MIQRKKGKKGNSLSQRSSAWAAKHKCKQPAWPSRITSAKQGSPDEEEDFEVGAKPIRQLPPRKLQRGRKVSVFYPRGAAAGGEGASWEGTSGSTMKGQVRTERATTYTIREPKTATTWQLFIFDPVSRGEKIEISSYQLFTFFCFSRLMSPDRPAINLAGFQ